MSSQTISVVIVEKASNGYIITQNGFLMNQVNKTVSTSLDDAVAKVKALFAE